MRIISWCCSLQAESSSTLILCRLSQTWALTVHLTHSLQHRKHEYIEIRLPKARHYKDVYQDKVCEQGKKGFNHKQHPKLAIPIQFSQTLLYNPLCLVHRGPSCQTQWYKFSFKCIPCIELGQNIIQRVVYIVYVICIIIDEKCPGRAPQQSPHLQRHWREMAPPSAVGC